MRPDTRSQVRTAATVLLKCAIEEDDASLLMLATATFAHVLAKGVDEETVRGIFRQAGLPEMLTGVLRGLHRILRPTPKLMTAKQRKEAAEFAHRVEMIDVEYSEFDLHVIFERNHHGYQAWLVEDPRHVGHGATFSEARDAFLLGLQRYFRAYQARHRLPEGVRAYVLRLHSTWVPNP